jgi:hypothetical protein
MWLTPNSMRSSEREQITRSIIETERTTYKEEYRQTTVPPGSLAEQVQYGTATADMKIWPTPRAARTSATNNEGIFGKGALALTIAVQEELEP